MNGEVKQVLRQMMGNHLKPFIDPNGNQVTTTLADGTEFYFEQKYPKVTENYLDKLDELGLEYTAYSSKYGTFEFKDNLLIIYAPKSCNTYFSLIRNEAAIDDVVAAIVYQSSDNISVSPVALLRTITTALSIKRRPTKVNDWQICYELGIITSETNSMNLQYYLLSSDVNVQYSNLMYFNLTEMLGAGNEPSTMNEFAQIFGYSSIDVFPYFDETYNGNVIVKGGKLWYK